jgi:hypothetical protein
MLHKILGKSVVLIALTGFLLLGGAKPLRAYDRCDHRIHKAERNLERAIRRYGLHSSQAERRRDQLERVRLRCHPSV